MKVAAKAVSDCRLGATHDLPATAGRFLCAKSVQSANRTIIGFRNIEYQRWRYRFHISLLLWSAKRKAQALVGIHYLSVAHGKSFSLF